MKHVTRTSLQGGHRVAQLAAETGRGGTGAKGKRPDDSARTLSAAEVTIPNSPSGIMETARRVTLRAPASVGPGLHRAIVPRRPGGTRSCRQPSGGPAGSRRLAQRWNTQTRSGHTIPSARLLSPQPKLTSRSLAKPGRPRRSTARATGRWPYAPNPTRPSFVRTLSAISWSATSLAPASGFPASASPPCEVVRVPARKGAGHFLERVRYRISVSDVVFAYINACRAMAITPEVCQSRRLTRIRQPRRSTPSAWIVFMVRRAENRCRFAGDSTA